MTAAYTGDCCPACGSDQVLPYAILIGGTEEYGYQCLTCQVTWPVLTYPRTATVRSAKRQENPAA
jgi:hypothetical protein